MDTLNRSAKRASLPLSPRDVQDIEKLRGSVVHRAALSKLSDTDVTESTSEAALLHAIMEAGMKAVSEQVEEAGYAAMAAGYDVAARKAIARRRPPVWADE